MRTLLQISLLVGIFYVSHGAGTEDLEAFIKHMIGTWQLRSPTILLEDNVLNICMSHQWLLCLSNDKETNEVATHLASIHKRRKQDSVIFIGNKHNDNGGLLTSITDVAPYLLGMIQ